MGPGLQVDFRGPPPPQGRSMKNFTLAVAVAALTTAFGASAASSVTDPEGQLITLEAGHASLQKWRLPATPPHPEDNAPTTPRVELGKKLFFDPRLSGDGNMSCATCHSPLLG